MIILINEFMLSCSSLMRFVLSTSSLTRFVLSISSLMIPCYHVPHLRLHTIIVLINNYLSVHPIGKWLLASWQCHVCFYRYDVAYGNKTALSHQCDTAYGNKTALSRRRDVVYENKTALLC